MSGEVVRPPRGWEPGVKIKDDGTGEAIVKLEPGEDPRWDRILTEMGYGDVLQFVRVAEVRSWEVYSKDEGVKLLRYVKCKVVRRMSKADAEDLDRLKDWILASDPGRSIALPASPDATLMVFLADWQMGKREGGGSKATAERIMSCARQVIDHAAQLRMTGLGLRDVILCGMGDMVEGCEGHYPMQAHQVDLHMRAQRGVVRRLLIAIAKLLRPHFDRITFRAVPGNHGEERKNGKAFTSFSDNNDVCIFDQLRDVLKEASWGEGIEVYTTSMVKPELSMSFEVEDSRGGKVRLGLAHGHQARGGPDKVTAWWGKCSASRHPIGYVDILTTGHYHHFRCEDRGERRTWFQCPTLDGGSFWWWSKGGNGSVPGMLTYVVEPSSPRGWSWAKVLTP